jgi:hypothetical protein
MAEDGAFYRVGPSIRGRFRRSFTLLGDDLIDDFVEGVHDVIALMQGGAFEHELETANECFVFAAGRSRWQIVRAHRRMLRRLALCCQPGPWPTPGPWPSLPRVTILSSLFQPRTDYDQTRKITRADAIDERLIIPFGCPKWDIGNSSCRCFYRCNLL